MKQSEIGERVTARGLFVVGACAAVVTIAVACGGKVTWVEDGSVNTGGAGSGTQSTGTKMVTSTSTSTSKATNVSASTGVSSACEKLCMTPGCESGSPQSCVTDCVENFYIPGCEAQADAFLNCAVENVDSTCELTTNACNGAIAAYQQCVNPGDCVEDFCDGGGEFCQCSGTCFGSKVSAVCKTGPMGIICSCTQNGMEIGSCTDSELSCSLDGGCCAQFFVPFD